ncbi:MAG TPA: hypothetical protein VGK84_02095 [Candidatus Tumulicola sp.]|jgi:uncharacterized protein (DUF2384 family)
MSVERKRVERGKRMAAARAWSPLLAHDIEVKPNAAQAFDVNEKLARLVATFGQNATARLLTWDAAQMRRCIKREEKISAPIAQRIVDLEYVVDRALSIFYPDEVGPWLSQPEPLLGEAIPLNVLALRGPAAVIAVLSRIGAGAFA